MDGALGRQCGHLRLRFDENQTFYFQAMGGSGAAEWSQRMFASIADIEARADTFASFIASGEQHCIIGYDNFYSVNVGGRRLVDWLADMVANKPVESVTCTQCDTPTPQGSPRPRRPHRLERTRRPASRRV